MRPFGALARAVAFAEALVLLLGLAAASGAGKFEQVKTATLALWVLGLWVFICLTTLLAGASASRPFRAAVGEPSSQKEAHPVLEAHPKVAASAIGLPATVSFSLFLSGLVGLALLGPVAGRWIATDLTLGMLGIGVSVSLLGAMLGYALTARTVAALLERIGNVDARRLGSMRMKILVLSAGVGVVGVLLVSSAGYIRFRESLVEDLVASAGSRVDAAVLEKPGARRRSSPGGEGGHRISGRGALGHREGARPGGGRPGGRRGSGGRGGGLPQMGGFTVKRWMRPWASPRSTWTRGSCSSGSSASSSPSSSRRWRPSSVPWCSPFSRRVPSPCRCGRWGRRRSG